MAAKGDRLAKAITHFWLCFYADERIGSFYRGSHDPSFALVRGNLS
jgi:hypothetical protein